MKQQEAIEVGGLKKVLDERELREGKQKEAARAIEVEGRKKVLAERELRGGKRKEAAGG